MKRILCLLFFIFFSVEAQMVAVVATLGQDKSKEVITTRTVHMDSLLESLAFQNPNLKDVLKSKMDSRTQSEQLERLLIQKIVFLESRNFERLSISKTDVQKNLEKIKSQLHKNSDLKELWGFLSLSDEDTKSILVEKLTFRKFMEIKTKASTIPSTDAEAFSYFQNNKSKFKDLKFEDVKLAIKSEISKEQSDQRLVDWIDVLKRKYDVRILSPN